MTTNVISNAITAVNEAKQKAVEAEAQSLIGYIQSEQATIKRLEADIVEHQKELAKTAHDVIDHQSVMGTAAPTNPNINEATIAKVIEDLNKAKQKSVEVVATRLSEAITNKQASIKATQDRIKDLREKLLKLQAEVVTEQTVLG
jgi:uncharacterized coiled-coil protein SlyX